MTRRTNRAAVAGAAPPAPPPAQPPRTVTLALRCKSTARLSSRSKDRGWTVVSIWDAHQIQTLMRHACTASRKVAQENHALEPKTVCVESIVCVRVPTHTRVVRHGHTYDVVTASGCEAQALTYDEWCKVFELPAADCVPHIMCMYGVDPRVPNVVTDYVQVVHPEEPWRISGWLKLSDLQKKLQEIGAI